MKTLYKLVLAAAVAPAGMFAVSQASAQTVHGHVQNEIGLPVTSGQVGFTHDTSGAAPAKYDFTFALDSEGNYKGTITPGSYYVFVLVDGKTADRLPLDIKANEDKTLDFDWSRPDYIAQLTPERRKQIEELKAKNAAALSTNKVIANLNATLKAVRDDLHSATPNYDKDVADMKAATTQKPDEGLLWITLADAQSAQADSMAAADRKSGKPPMSDQAVLDTYTDAVTSFQKGIDLMKASKKPVPADEATAYNQMGSALAREGKVADAQAAYENAVTLDPAGAGMYYGNEAAILYNAASTGNAALGDGALAAAEKAIAADPKRPDPYYIKGQLLLQKAGFDSKTNKILPAPGTVEAYNKYLELDPDGKYAQSVKEVLQGLGEKIDTRYSAAKKK